MEPIDSDRSVASIVASCGLFSALNEEQLAKLVEISVVRNFQKQQQIFVEGEQCPGIYIVDGGLVRIYRSGTDGQQHILHLCGPDQTIAEVAVFGDFPLPANAIAARQTRCVLIPAEQLKTALHESHSLCLQLLAGMSKWTRHFVQLLDDIVLRDATSRVARLLSSLPENSAGRLELPGPRKDIANHLNLCSETFSRVLRRLSDQKLIELTSDRQIRIVDRGPLQGMSDA